MKRLKLCILLSSILLLNGCGKKNPGPAVPTATQTEQPTAVSVQIAQKSSIMNSDTFSGRTKAGTEISVTSEISGTVEEVYVTTGQKVKKGDLLLTINGDETNQAMEKAKAALEVAQASYNSSIGGNIEKQIEQLESAVASARTSYEDAKRNYDKYEQLYETGTVSEEEFKQIELKFTQAKQSLSSAENSYEIAKNKTIPESQASAQKSLEQAQVTYNTALSDLDKLNIVSPISGIITTTNFSENEMISQSKPAFIISNLDTLEVNLQITEMDIDKFKVGDVVSAALSQQAISGKVAEVSRVTDSTTSLYVVKVTFDNSNYNFPAGMAVEIQLATEKSENVVIIPKKAIFEEEGKQYLYLCTDNKAVKTNIETGISDSFNIEIKQGVNEGDLVVIGGISLIKDGDSLFPVEKEE